jgi:hypothetical protein
VCLMDECEQVVFETSVTKAVAFLAPELTAASARAARRGPTPSTCAACGPPLGIGVGQGLWWPACPCGVPAVAVRVPRRDAMVCARGGGGGGSLMKCGRCRWAQQRRARGARPDGEHGGGGGEEHQIDEGSEATGARVIR